MNGKNSYSLWLMSYKCSHVCSTHFCWLYIRNSSFNGRATEQISKNIVLYTAVYLYGVRDFR